MLRRLYHLLFQCSRGHHQWWGGFGKSPDTSSYIIRCRWCDKVIVHDARK